jgi:hypothetical protein
VKTQAATLGSKSEPRDPPARLGFGLCNGSVVQPLNVV